MLPLLAMGALSVASSVMGSSASKKAATVQRTQGLQQEAASWDQNYAENKALDASNLQNMIRTGYKVGLLNVQRAQAKKAAMQQGIDLSRSALSATGAAQANAAASGGIGSSVSAIEQDIQQRVDEAGARMGDDYENTELNFDTMLNDIITNGQDAQGSSVKANIMATPAAQYTGMGQAIGGALIQTAGTYYASKLSLGSVKPPGT